MILLRQSQVHTLAGMERKGNIIIRVTITRGATIKVSISETDRYTQGINTTRGGPIRRTKKSKPSPKGNIDSYPYLLSSIAFRKENKNLFIAL
jgi:hypothetical protein